MSVFRMWWFWRSCVLVLIMGLDIGNVVRGVQGIPSNVSCSSVRTKYHGTGLQDKIPVRPISGLSLEVCGRAPETCCSPQVESALSVESRKQFDDALADRLEPLASLMGGRMTHFDDLFYGLLNYSRSSFDAMFRKTYGMIYLQNARVFDDLYTSLESYYSSGRPDIGDSMDQFFKKFYQRMFVVYNSQYSFSDQYLTCVLTYMETLQPFGDVPSKFGSSVKRSFVALRTFVRGLNTSASVVRNLLKVNPSVSCVRELMRLTHCSTCQGMPDVRPCLPYCLHVHQHCLHHLHQFSTDWKNFVDAMVTVGDRLLNPFNIENVVRPINLQISDAVMNFQVAGANISNMIFQGCGQPSLGRSKRDAVAEPASLPEQDIATNLVEGSPSKRDAQGQDYQRERQGEEYQRGRQGEEYQRGRQGERDPQRGRGAQGGRRRMRPRPTQDGVANNRSRSGGARPGQRGRGRGRGSNRRKPVGAGRRGEGGVGGARGGGELSLERLDFSASSGGEGEELPPSLNRVIREIKTKLENSRQFLEELSPQLCGQVASAQDSSCWTGMVLGRSADTPLPELSQPPPHSGVHEQIYRLQSVTRALQAAANGQDIPWMQEQRVNDAVIVDEGSGSGGGWPDDERGWSDDDSPTVSTGGGRRRQQQRPVRPDHNFPPDDEDGYAMGSGDGPSSPRGGYDTHYRGGSRDDYYGADRGMNGGDRYPGYDDSESNFDAGSGDYGFKKTNRKNNYSPPYQPNRPNYGVDNTHPSNHPPSGVAKEDMTLTKAITVYLIPAIIMYFGSIG